MVLDKGEKILEKIKIVFVCLGNYCRSPMAEAIFKDLARQDGLLDAFEVSSAGTKDWDLGLCPDYRTRKILADHNIPLDPDKRARLLTDQDLREADYILVMTGDIAEDLGNRANVYRIMDFVPNSQIRDIPDPYPTDTFPQAFILINRGVKAFYENLKAKHSGSVNIPN